MSRIPSANSLLKIVALCSGILVSNVHAEKPIVADPATASSTAFRPRSTIDADLQRSISALREMLHGGDGLTDPKRRSEIAAKAILAIKEYHQLFRELAMHEALARENMGSMSAQLWMTGMVFGDAESEAELKKLSASGTADAAEAAILLVRAKWILANTDAEAQRKLLFEAATILKANSRNDRVSGGIFEMADAAANSENRAAVQKLIIDEAKGQRSNGLIRAIQTAQRLKAQENKAMVLTAVTINGENFSTADWKGKVILVNFWATWCAPCKDELPRIKKVYAEYHNKGLEIVGVSCDKVPGQLKDFMAANKTDMPWPQLYDEKTPGWHPLATEIGIDTIPTLVLIDRKGVVRTVEAREKFEEIIPKLLEEK